MAADREPPTLADYVITAISPVLIMLMVGSLVFFLVEVLYAGKYSDRLLYTMFFFVIGAVLVARIAIQLDGARATMYGVGLGIVTFLAMNTYVEFPADTPLASVAWLVNLALMALIWWSAHKLTWDCTHIDENRDASGRGLLSAAGLDADAAEETGDGKQETGDRRQGTDKKATPERGKKKKKAKKKHESALWNWITRYQKHRAGQRAKPHTPGVWVIYFSLAALPLFALGQSLISADDADRRRATFLQMAVYVASGLALLVTTSFLGLRRYLRQRKAKIPAALTASWLGLGGVLIVVFLVLGAFLPRPHSEVPWFGLQRAGKEERDASDYAVLKDSAGKGEGAEGNVAEKGEGSASGKDGEKGGSKGEKGSGGKGEGKSAGGKGEKSGQSSGGEKGDATDGKNQDSASKDKSGKSDDQKSGPGGKSERDGGKAKGKSGEKSKPGGASPPKTGVMAAVEKVAGVVKWIVFAIVAILVVIGIVLGVLRFLAPFTNWAKNLLDAIRNWWANLFGGRANGRREPAGEVAPVGPQRPPPFHDYSNPFADGSAGGRDPAELVIYTFAALDSWAWDRGHGRQPTKTPLEFAARLGEQFAEFQPNLRRLANLYARVAYSELPLPADTAKFLERVWDQLVHGVDVGEPVAIGEEGD